MHRVIVATHKAALTGDNRHLIECLSQVSPSAYLKLMARWHFNEVYDAAFVTALCYFLQKLIYFIWHFGQSLYIKRIIKFSLILEFL